MAISLFVAEHYPTLRHTALGAMVGGILSGAFVGTSNLSIMLAGSSIFLFGVDSQIISVAIIISCCACGAVMDAKKYLSRTSVRAKKIHSAS